MNMPGRLGTPPVIRSYGAAEDARQTLNRLAALLKRTKA